jgi:predicted RNA-binding Zn ribbon-like protein
VSRVVEADPLLDFVVDFCNTHDLLNDPADRLSIALAHRIAAHHDVALRVREADLERLRNVRDALMKVFAAPVEAKGAAVNEILDEHGARAQLDGDLRLTAVGGADAVARFAIACADALARALADGGAERLRTCVGEPCRCVYVDRTRANRRRYCCELCNDRMASAAYRRRAQQKSVPPE